MGAPRNDIDVVVPPVGAQASARSQWKLTRRALDAARDGAAATRAHVFRAQLVEHEGTGPLLTRRNGVRFISDTRPASRVQIQIAALTPRSTEVRLRGRPRSQEQ